eukprot:TRINITY_DN10472_c0_g1_i1.p1 TRINITY_DN10472_c0_g1~~TRINITY_DN10472_c0_g1_i1.p1  ORF type:complete len:210 (+),score=3.49 TRINITY_DN10472_c0_g1_i1:158-787(+)
MTICDRAPKFTALAPLIPAKYTVGLVQIYKKYIYAIAGFMGKKDACFCVKDCGVYSIAADKCRHIPLLNKAKPNIFACSFNDRYIFAFDLEIDSQLSNYIESYDALDEERGWAFYDRSKLNLNSDLYGLRFAHQVSPNELLLFGTGYIYYRKVKEDKIVEAEPTDLLSCYFIPESAKIHKGKVYWASMIAIKVYDLTKKKRIQNLKIIY